VSGLLAARSPAVNVTVIVAAAEPRYPDRVAAVWDSGAAIMGRVASRKKPNSVSGMTDK
jgi:hypothetical protein